MNKFFDSTMPSALALSGTAGALRAILKTYLVDGSGTTAVASISVTSEIATVTYASGHPFRVGAVGLFSGITPSGLNGEKRILTSAANVVTFAAPGVANGAGSGGSMSSKLASAGWSELFAGTLTNVLALMPSAAEASGAVLRLDDTGTTTARVVGYEAMTDINAGTGVFPTAAQVSGGMYWPKSNAADSSARAWMLFADDLAFHLWIAPHTAFQQHGVFVSFGDMLADKSGDAYSALLTGGPADVSTVGSAVGGCLGFAHGTSAGSQAYVPRAYTGLGGSQLAKKVAAHNIAAGYSGTTAYNPNSVPYPNGADNSLRLSPIELLVGTAGFRGRVAGVFHTPQIVGDSLATGDLVPGSGDYAGQTFVALRVGPPTGSLSIAGTAFVNLTAWR